MAPVGNFGRIMASASLFLILAADLRASYPVELGIIGGPEAVLDAKAEWDWAVRGSSIRFSPVEVPADGPFADTSSLLILEGACLTSDQFARLESWVARGGLLLVNGAHCREKQQDPKVQERRVELAGLSIGPPDPGLSNVYPRVTETTPILAPFSTGDGIRLGKTGPSQPVNLAADSASILARGYRVEPGAGQWIRASDAITIATRKLRRGRVVFLNFSLAEVTACHPNEQGRPIDCSGAGTGRALMRFLVANLLWEESGQQIPLRWETPGDQAVGVVLTGDVHGDDEAYQVRSARLMAERIATADSPISYFAVGEVSEQSPRHLEELRLSPGVVIGTHSARGDKYRPGSVSGVNAVFDDIREAESLLGLPSYPHERRWRAGIRSHGWASNESAGGAWTAMDQAGISVVFDHNADPALEETNVSALVEWFEGDVNKRLYVPMLERSIHTEADDSILAGELSGSIFSLGSPEPDPCCNWAVTFETYTEYVRNWHEQFLKLGSMGGAIEVWLWHPSTPVWKGGLDGLRSFVEALVADERVELFGAHELATWAYNREKVNTIARWDAFGLLTALETEIDERTLAPLPPGSKSASRTISYWVLGPADLQGWRSTRSENPLGRTVTILTKALPTGSARP